MDGKVVNELMDVIENNRRLCRMEMMFPRRFEQIDERMIEKRQEEEENK